jgi:hypothetical protein
MRARRWVGLVVVAAFVQPEPAAGCGDKLAMMGGGVRFERINHSRHRGSVVMLAAPSAIPGAAAVDIGLKKSLQRAGHRVRVLQGADELEPLLRAGEVDVVLLDGSAADGMQRQLTTSGRGGRDPVVFTVVHQPVAQSTVPHLDRLCVIEAARHGRQVLEAIEKALAAQARGDPVSCRTSPQVQST